MSYEEGRWHAIIGLEPQYDHMKGTQAYDLYMKGYNESLEEAEETENE